MKQSVGLFYLSTLLAVLSLTGVKYVEPTLDGITGIPFSEWKIISQRLQQDMGVELWFPMLSLVFFILCTLIATITERFRNTLFILSLLNVLYTVAIYFILQKFFIAPNYTMENGYYLHLISSISLQILAISTLRKVNRKPRKSVDLDLLDDAL